MQVVGRREHMCSLARRSWLQLCFSTFTALRLSVCLSVHQSILLLQYSHAHDVLQYSVGYTVFSQDVSTCCRMSFIINQRFCARQHAIARIIMLSPVRPSVTRVIQSKTVEVRIMQLSPPGSSMTLVSSRLTSPRNSKGNFGDEGAK